MAKAVEGKFPNKTVTVIIRSDGPMIFCGDSPTYRSVRLELTDAQVAALELKYVGEAGPIVYHETISQMFIEPLEG